MMRDFNRNNRGGGDRGNRNGFSNRGGGDREMFDAVCDNCGRDCRVPFRPTSGKPIYCSECFEDLGNGREDRGFIDSRSPRRERNDYNRSDSRGRDDNRSNSNPVSTSPDLSQLKEQLSSISTKLDKLIKIITPLIPVETEIPMLDEVKERKIRRSVKKSDVNVE